MSARGQARFDTHPGLACQDCGDEMVWHCENTRCLMVRCANPGCLRVEDPLRERFFHGPLADVTAS